MQECHVRSDSHRDAVLGAKLFLFFPDLHRARVMSLLDLLEQWGGSPEAYLQQNHSVTFSPFSLMFEPPKSTCCILWLFKVRLPSGIVHRPIPASLAGLSLPQSLKSTARQDHELMQANLVALVEQKCLAYQRPAPGKLLRCSCLHARLSCGPCRGEFLGLLDAHQFLMHAPSVLQSACPS